MRRSYVGMVTALLFALVMAGGCSDDDEKPKDQGVDTVDSQTPDLGVDSEVPDIGSQPDITVDHNMGEGCTSNSDCKGTNPVCLTLSKDKGLGICSMACSPDDTTTPLINEDNCPTGYLCATFRFTSKDYFYCLKKCTPDQTKNPCPASSKQTCHPFSTYYSGDLAQAVCWYLACENDKDCPVFSDVPCTGDSQCSGVASDAYCDSTEGMCARPGKCNTTSGLCDAHQAGKAGAAVGDPCTSDLDCPNGGICMKEYTDPNVVGTAWHNGYCTKMGCAFSGMTDYACGTGEDCYQLFYGGRCVKSCKQDDASTCRGSSADDGGDYECYSFEGFVVGGSTPVASGPICISAAGETCPAAGGSSTCASFGDSTNSTNMDCRDRFTGQLKSPGDPTGVCLDDTASGPFQAAADGGTVTPDMGTPDVGTPDMGTPDAGAQDAVVGE